MKNILELDHNEAKKFFLKQESYVSFNLPPYFLFNQLLEVISNEISGENLESHYKNYNANTCKPNKPYPSEIEEVNYSILNNKDGKFAWRPLQIIHPAIYVALVHKITEAGNWEIILERFDKFFSNSQIECHSLPKVSDSKQSDKAVSIYNWWHEIEQQSIELALEYEFIMHTDIKDCYSSIYTHSIPWAIHTKTFAKSNRSEKHIGNLIDRYIRDMSFGQTNGIPQGSVLMDFIAEMILGYVDLKLGEKINDSNIEHYKILRYRDDYRIFTNNTQHAELITKLLTETLITLGMSLNAQKTRISNNVIRDSVKPDKLYWNLHRQNQKGLQNQLLLIHRLSVEYPNSGSLIKELDKLYSRVLEMGEIKENITVLISILVDITFKNPGTYHIVCGILSTLISRLNYEKKDDILNLIDKRFEKIPNTGHIKIWLQRLTIKLKRETDYDEMLCKVVNNIKVSLWDSSWLNDRLNKIVNETPIIDEKIIDDLDTIIQPDEIKLFDY